MKAHCKIDSIGYREQALDQVNISANKRVERVFTDTKTAGPTGPKLRRTSFQDVLLTNTGKWNPYLLRKIRNASAAAPFAKSKITDSASPARC